MARIFVSYSRVDIPFTEGFVERLSHMFPDVEVWHDDRLLGGDIWWDEILNQIALCDVFIYLLSNESIQSPYCQAEFTEARRLQKRVVTVQIRDRTKLTNELDYIHYVDMKGGVDDPDAVARLGGAVRSQLSKARKKRPLWQPRTPKPEPAAEQPRSAQAPEIDTPTLQNPLPPPNALLEKPWYRDPRFLIGAILVPLLTVIIGGLMTLGNDGGNGSTQVPTPVVQVPSDTPTLTPSLTATYTPTPTLTPSLTSTATPTLSATELEQMVETEISLALTENVQTVAAFETLTVTALTATRWAEGLQATQEANHLTATATLWTATPTLDLRATAHARLTETQDALIVQATSYANATATQWPVDQTATADSWTDTPTSTFTPTVIPSNTPAVTLTPTATPDPLQLAKKRAENFTGSNDDWEPFEWDFDGVKMVLVPKGCFMMGSDSYDDEKPVHQVCFETPFWIDQVEVTNEQFGTFNGQSVKTSAWTDDNRPRETITRGESQAFCESRGAQLPTEAEWEYAARGPASWIYPWGDDESLADDRAVWSENSGDAAAEVGSKPQGKSWVGALDMSGNAWEWVADWYSDEYYASLPDGVVNPPGPKEGEYYVIRGGSWKSSPVSLLRTAGRIKAVRTAMTNEIGFRCVRPLDNSSMPPEAGRTEDLHAAVERAQNFSGSNGDWEPFWWEFDGAQMMLVPRGSFEIGNRDGYRENERPVTEQDIPAPFWIDRTEVTWSMYLMCTSPDCADAEQILRGYPGFDLQEPARLLNWNQANAYCQWRGARLPSEKEWEYVARGPANWIYPWGNEFIGDFVVYQGNSAGPEPVDSRSGDSSWVGAVDMAGNVREWTNSIYRDYPYDQDDGRENVDDQVSARVIRGGAYSFTEEDLYSARRYYLEPDSLYLDVGFRCLRDLSE